MSLKIGLFVCIFTLAAASKSYSGYSVWQVTPETIEQQNIIFSWNEKNGIDFWNIQSTIGASMRIMVSPEIQKYFEKSLTEFKIPHKLITDDVQKMMKVEKRTVKFDRNESFPLHHYWSTNEINDYVQYLALRFPDICTMEIVSHSGEGKLMRALKISVAGNGTINGTRPIVVIDAGIHAREWVAPMTAVNFIRELVENAANHSEYLEKIDIVIIPIMNPDGYEYSRSHDRFWRKTRSRNPGSTCFGVDGNRNYPHMFQLSSYPCSDIFSGREPFSEPETRALGTIIERYNSSIKLYVSLHAQGKEVLYPWGYAPDLIENWEEHHEVGQRFSDAVYLANPQARYNYTVGNAAIVLYPAFGASDDYAAYSGVNLAYTIELPPGGWTGYDPPPEELATLTQETFMGFQEMLKYVANKKW